MTGTHGVLTYPDRNNNPTPIYLFNNTYVPAHKYYWKVVQDPMTNTAVAFIGSNDPCHISPLGAVSKQVTCPIVILVLYFTPRCAEMPWVDWNLSDLDSGYMYCCSVEDAVKAIPAIPAMQSAGLLTLQGPGLAPGPSPSSGTCTA